MLCPEVWNFEAPKHSFKIKREKAVEDLLKDTVHFNFNHLVCAVVPDFLNVPTSKLTVDCEYYKICDLNPSHLLDPEFISCFVLNGKLSLLSIDKRIDCDDCITLTPKGLLVLSLNKETYQSLGIEGKLSHFHTKARSRYVVTIDLTDTEVLHPDKSTHKRIVRRLATLPPFDAIAVWQPPGPEVCPSSLAAYFSALGHAVRECSPRFSSHVRRSLGVPSIDDVEIVDVAEWLGMAATGADLDVGEGPASYLNSYATPEPNVDVGRTRVLKWTGLFTGEKVGRLVTGLMNDKNLEGNHWAAVYVQGFSDSAVAWGKDEHHFYTHGDNSYLFIFNNEKRLLCTQKCSTKRYK